MADKALFKKRVNYAFEVWLFDPKFGLFSVNSVCAIYSHLHQSTRVAA